MDDWTKIRQEYIDLETKQIDHETKMFQREMRFYQGIEKVIYIILLLAMVGSLYIFLRMLVRI